MNNAELMQSDDAASRFIRERMAMEIPPSVALPLKPPSKLALIPGSTPSHCIPIEPAMFHK